MPDSDRIAKPNDGEPKKEKTTDATRVASTPRLFACCGLHSSGSTWVFNLVREICRDRHIDFVSLHRDYAKNLPWANRGSRLIIAKTHNPREDFRSTIANSNDPAIITVRDPRDAVASLMQRFDQPFEKAIEVVVSSAGTLVDLSRRRLLPTFRYEEGFIGRINTYDLVCALLGVVTSVDVRGKILNDLTPEAVRRKIQDLTTIGAISEERNVYDADTQWHANHVGDGKIGKFADVLSSSEQREILELTQEYCERFGYAIESSPLSFTTVNLHASDRLEQGVPKTVGEEPALRLGDTSLPKTIGLCMIVKNETKSILGCLASVRALVDYMLVVDTGSTDGTQQMVRDYLAEIGMSGVVIEEPWRNFAYNRTFALERLREEDGIDYALMIDADDVMERDAGFDPHAFKLHMTQDIYDVPIRHGGISHSRPQICSNRKAFSYKGVLHEYLEGPPGGFTRGDATGFAIRAGTSGARSQNPRKYQDDAALLEQALASETDAFLVSRYTFYLAQSYRDCGEKERSLKTYLKRAELGHWNEEVYVSLLEAGNLMAALDRPYETVISAFERAQKTVPTRAEALHAAAHYCRNKGKNAEGMEFARRGLAVARPSVGLFLHPWVYEYGLLDEFCINAYWAEAFQDSLDAALKLLADDKLPPAMVKRIASNARFAAGKLPRTKTPELGRFGAEDFVAQHALQPQRNLRSQVSEAPRVLVAILVKQKEAALPLYLDCIEALDYPKSSIVLYIRTNNNTDRSEQLLRDWVARVGHLYSAVEFDASNVTQRVEQFGEHEWNATRFSVLGRIRNTSMQRALELKCDYYFVADVDNFIRRSTLRELVALDLPVVAPFLRLINPNAFYSNYHAEIDPAGYFKACDQYFWILNRHVRGVVEVPVVHCTYLIRADVIPELTYEDDTERHEYVVFSNSARTAGIPQYFDNRQIYGYITFGEGEQHHVEGGVEKARILLNDTGDAAPFVETVQKSSGSEDVLPIHLINLDRSTDRLTEFKARNSHLKRIVRFSAIDGKTVDRNELIKGGIIAGDLGYSAGTLGCAMSHITMWKEVAVGDTPITIAEDDGVFSHQFDKESKALISSLHGDWDVVIWSLIPRLYAWVDALPGGIGAKIEFREGKVLENLEIFQSAEPVRSLLPLRHIFGLVCYSLTPRGARALLERCLPLKNELIEFPGFGVRTPNEGIDCVTAGVFRTLKSFVCVPPMVIVDDRAAKSVRRNM